MHFLQYVANGSGSNRRVLLAADVVLAHGVVQQGERHVDQFLGAQDEWARLECLLLKEGEVQAEVKGSGDVDSVVVQLQDVLLQLRQHLHGKSVFE